MANKSSTCEFCHRSFIPKDKRHKRFCCHNCFALFQSGSILPPEPITKITTYEEAWKIWDKTIGLVKSRIKDEKKKESKSNRKKILLCSDLHVQFHDKEKVALMLEREKDADVCIIAGDFGDNFALSRFIKYENIPFETELAEATLLLEIFSKTFPKVILITGNHDMRLEKHIRERLSDNFISAILFLTDGKLDYLSALVKRFDNVEISKHTVEPYEIRWLYQLGDVLISHAKKYSKVIGSALRGVEEYFLDFEKVYSLKPYRIIAQAHTHQLSLFPYRADKILLETGCLCKTMGYQLAARISGRPQRCGYITFNQINKVTEINSIKITFLDN